MSASFSGPLPPPATLQRYSEVIDNGAERIFQMAERNQAHRHELEQAAIRSEIRTAERGVVWGGVIALAGLACAGFLGWMGHEGAAGIVGGGTLATMVTAFVYGTRSRRKERQEKNKRMAGLRRPEDADDE